MTTPDRDPDSKAPPFPRHRTYYIVLKWLVIAAAVYVAFRLANRFLFL